MKERPILMTPENAQKVHDGTKTQTRRVLRSQPPEDSGEIIGPEMYAPTEIDKFGEEYPGEDVFGVYSEDGQWGCPCPYGIVGDRLWIREAVAYKEEDLVAYKGDGSCGAWMGDGAGGRFWISHGWIQGCSSQPGRYFGLTKYGGAWRPSIHMPRWACRSVVELTEIRVEQVQDISEEDAKAEGCYAGQFEYENAGGTLSCRESFKCLWDSINGNGAWERNEWVWVIGMKKMQP